MVTLTSGLRPIPPEDDDDNDGDEDDDDDEDDEYDDDDNHDVDVMFMQSTIHGKYVCNGNRIIAWTVCGDKVYVCVSNGIVA